MRANRLFKMCESRPIRFYVWVLCGAIFLFFVLPSQIAYADGGASLLNDVGDGAFIWGSPSEQTTYIGPYNSMFPATISQLPVSNDRVVQNSEGSLSSFRTGNLKVPADQWKNTKESGLVFGTDGKAYEYTLIEGVEPRRHVERRRVRETPPGALQPIWVDKNVERTVWEPVLIRVLRPANSSVVGASSSSPAPCDKTENVSEPPLTKEPPVDPAAPLTKEPPVDPGVSKQPTLGSTETTYDADGGMTVTVVTPDRNESRPNYPVLVLPNKNRTSRQK